MARGQVWLGASGGVPPLRVGGPDVGLTIIIP